MNPQERKQITILSSTIVVVLAGGAFWVRSVMGSTPPPPTPTITTSAAPQVVADNRPAANVQRAAIVSPPSAAVTPKVNIPPGGDPFRKVLEGDTGAPVTLAEAQARADENRRQQLAKLNQKTEAPFIPGSMPGRMQGTPLPPDASSIKPFSPTEALNDTFKLEGILSNDKGPMAVISFGGTTLYLKPGDTFGDGIRVASIRRQYAIFSRGKETYRADVGGGLQ